MKLIPSEDPKVLEKADVVVSSYNTVASEHGVFDPPAKNEGKKKASKSQKSSQGFSDDSDSDVGRTIKKAPAKKKDALFHVKWWRIVLGKFLRTGSRRGFESLAQTRRITLRIETPRQHSPAVPWKVNSVGVLLELQCKDPIVAT